jgi:hypothetical protein
MLPEKGGTAQRHMHNEHIAQERISLPWPFLSYLTLIIKPSVPKRSGGKSGGMNCSMENPLKSKRLGLNQQRQNGDRALASVFALAEAVCGGHHSTTLRANLLSTMSGVSPNRTGHGERRQEHEANILRDSAGQYSASNRNNCAPNYQ